MREPQAIRQLNDSNRLVAYYSDNYSFEDVFGDGVRIHTIRCDRGFRPHVASFLAEYTEDGKVDAIACSKALTEAGYPWKSLSLPGQAPIDWSEVFVFIEDSSVTDEYFALTVQMVREWDSGFVYDVEWQEAKIFTAEDGETITRWDEVETWDTFVGEPDDVLEQVQASCMPTHR